MPARRQCVQNAERDAYIDQRRESGVKEIGVRILERYIDEFLRFCHKNYRFTCTKGIAQEHITAFAEAKRKEHLKKETARLKVNEVLKWLKWLTEKDHIREDPGEQLEAWELVP